MVRTRLALISALLFSSLGAFTSSARAEENSESPEEESSAAARHRLQWFGRRFQVVDYAATAVLFGGSIAIDKGTSPRKEPRWTGGILFDDAGQRAILGETRAGRASAQELSGYFTITPQIVAVVDGAAVPLLFDRFNWDVAWHMSLLNIQAMSLNGILTRSGHRLVARERPDAEYCRDDPDFSERCGHGSTSSFPSGHTSTAFVGAGLVCAHHLALPLYGHRVADIGACALQVGVASTAGVLRVATGRHYLTDVIAGAAVGATAGFILPTLIYYRKPKSRRDEVTRWILVPSVTSRSAGLGVAGVF